MKYEITILLALFASACARTLPQRSDDGPFSEPLAQETAPDTRREFEESESPTATDQAGNSNYAGSERADEPQPSIRSGDDEDLQARGMRRAPERGPSGEEALSSRLFSMTVKVQGRDGGWWSLPLGGELHSGEAYFVELELTRAAFVYVVGKSNKGRAYLLFPDAELGDQDVRHAAGLLRVPGRNSDLPMIELDDCPDTEHIVVFASKRKLTSKFIQLAMVELDGISAERNTRRKKISTGSTRAPSRPRVSEADLWSNVNERRPEVQARGNSTSLDVAASDDGIARLNFTIEHGSGSRPVTCPD